MISAFNSIWRYHLEQMISAGSDEPVAVLIPSAVHDCRFVRMDCRENLGNTRVDMASILVPHMVSNGHCPYWCHIWRSYWCHNAQPVLTLGPTV